MEKLKQPKGYFEYQLIKDGKVIQSFQEHNLIHHNAYRLYTMFAAGIVGSASPEALNLVTLCLGDRTTGGLSSDDNRLNAEISGNSGNTYGISWDGGLALGSQSLVINSEGSGNNNYTGTTGSDVTTGTALVREESVLVDGVLVKLPSGVIEFNFEIGTDAANNANIEWNEAALYMKHQKNLPGMKLGTIFSSKSFPGLAKTDACTLKLRWIIDFSF